MIASWQAIAADRSVCAQVITELRRRPSASRSTAMLGFTLHELYSSGDVMVAGMADESAPGCCSGS